MKKLVLIDGNAIVHRAFHALPPLTHGKGIMTNAVYGFFSMVLKILQDISPDYLVVCFDRAAPNFRQELYAGYQATRPAMSDELSPQFDILNKVLDRAKIRVEGIDGFEADDLIGTLSKQASEKGIQSIILTGDRDMLQLVNHNTLVIAPITGVTKTTLFNEAAVKEKYGLLPTQLVDYKALVGDPSDNYPGVSGIGPKTASDLVNKFGSLEGVYKHLGDVNPKVGVKLAQDAEQAALAKKLATIVRDAPVKLKFSDCEMKNIDTEAMFLAFNELGFRSLIARFGSFDTSSRSSSAQAKKTVKEKSKDEQLGLI